MLKIRAHGGEKVQRGSYWSFDTGERVTMDGPGILPGGRDTTYYKGHPVMLVLAAPILGLVYAAFLPAVGFVMAAGALIEKVVGSVAENFAKASVFSWRPSEAYLAGRKRKKGEKKARKEDKPPTEKDQPKE